MKSKILLLLSTLFLSLPVFAVTGLPPGTQFHLSTGNLKIPTYPYIQECQGSCIYIEDVDGFPRTWAGINVGETDHISNNVTLPLNYAERIGNVSITSYVYRLMAWRGQQPDLSTVLPASDCSDATTPCTPFSRTPPLYLLRNSDAHEFMIWNTAINNGEWHIKEWKKQGDYGYMVVTGTLFDRTCGAGCTTWPHGAKVELRLIGRLSTWNKVSAINAISGTKADATLTIHGDNLSSATEVKINGLPAPWVVIDDNTLLVTKGTTINVPVFAEVTTPTGKSRYPENAKVTY